MTRQENLFDYIEEAKKRDRALDSFEEKKSTLVSLAKEVALRLFNQNGEVTSPQVLAVLKSLCPNRLEQTDPRFMGAVFRKGWVRVRFENKGSHCRPVSVWIKQ